MRACVYLLDRIESIRPSKWTNRRTETVMTASPTTTHRRPTENSVRTYSGTAHKAQHIIYLSKKIGPNKDAKRQMMTEIRTAKETRSSSFPPKNNNNKKHNGRCSFFPLLFLPCHLLLILHLFSSPLFLGCVRSLAIHVCACDKCIIKQTTTQQHRHTHIQKELEKPNGEKRTHRTHYSSASPFSDDILVEIYEIVFWCCWHKPDAVISWRSARCWPFLFSSALSLSLSLNPHHRPPVLRCSPRLSSGRPHSDFIPV